MRGYRMSKAGVCCLRAQQEISEEAGVSEPDSRIPPPPGKFFSISLCLLREDVYHVVKAFAMIGEWVSAEAKLYTQVLVRSKNVFVLFLVCRIVNVGC
ncbi:hypothetical protein RchiOBHm_Chr4g0444651 [Rosa chinensis]|uniref:Uncharacterized protein n=1 Tax=Rosa chinensis TaxID=74649 RepID=A0A2P6R495_ROSCH|nr:hypothetical protein RchiOBHm_Chr4g0444651 [Rosa chinensis]